MKINNPVITIVWLFCSLFFVSASFFPIVSHQKTRSCILILVSVRNTLLCLVLLQLFQLSFSASAISFQWYSKQHPVCVCATLLLIFAFKKSSKIKKKSKQTKIFVSTRTRKRSQHQEATTSFFIRCTTNNINITKKSTNSPICFINKTRQSILSGLPFNKFWIICAVNHVE